jgi:hypothetical protein
MTKKLSRTLLAVLISTLSLSVASFAQDQSGTSSSSQSQSATSSSGHNSMTGCLSGPNDEGAYVLKSNKGRSFEVGGNDQLKQHVGHTVRLTGSWVKSGSEIGENEAAEKNEKSEGAEHHGVAERHFKVTDIQHIADTCSSSGSTGPKM